MPARRHDRPGQLSQDPYAQPLNHPARQAEPQLMPQYAASQPTCPREPERSNDPYPPCLAPRACRRAALPRLGDQGPPGTLLGVVTLGYSGQPVGVEAIAATTGGPTPPTDLHSDRPRRGLPEQVELAGIVAPLDRPQTLAPQPQSQHLPDLMHANLP